MILYLAGAENTKAYKLLNKVHEHILMSYFYLKGKGLENFENIQKHKILLDSGAFTAFSQKKQISLDTYCKYIIQNKKYIHIYANLDVIGDAEATLENQKKMEQKGLKPLPTYHQGEPIYYFEKYVNEYEYIGIGGMVGGSKKQLQKLLDFVFGYIFKRKLKTKIHGWGMTIPEFIKRYPFYSVDSTSWLSGARYKTIYFIKNNQLKSYKAEYFRKKLQKDFGIKNDDELNLHNIKMFQRYIQYVDKLHKVKKMNYYDL